MAKRPRAEIEIGLDTEPAEEELEEFSGRIEKGLLDTNVSLRDLSRAWNAVEGAVAGAAKQAGEWVIKAKDAGRADREFVRELNDLTKAGEDFGVSMGTAITQSGAAKGALSALKTAVFGLQEQFGDKGAAKNINSFFSSINVGLANMLQAFVGVRAAVRDFAGMFDKGGAFESAGRLAAFMDDKLGGGFFTKSNISRLRELGKSLDPETDKLLDEIIADLMASSRRGVEPTGFAPGKKDKEDEKAEDAFVRDAEAHLKKRAAERAEIQKTIEERQIEHMKVMADLDLKRLIADREATDAQNEQLMESAKKRKEILDFTFDIMQQGAQATLGATKAAADTLLEAIVTGQKLSANAFAQIIADMMIQQGWAFQSQAIAYTFEAIANYGSTAWRAAAMGSAAKTLLIAGYSLKAATGGKGAAPGGGGMSASGGGGGAGAGAGAASNAGRQNFREPGSSGMAAPPIVYNVNFNGPVTDPRRTAQELERLMRDGRHSTVPGGRSR